MTVNNWTVTPLNGKLGDFAPAWDNLLSSMFDGNPMLDSRFVDSLLAHFGDGTEQLCVMHRNGKEHAMCILRPGPLVWSTFLPSQAQVAPALIPDADSVKGLFKALPRSVGQIDCLANDPDFGDVSMQDNRVNEARDHALTISVSLAGDFNIYWEERSKNLRKNIARYERRVAEEHKTATLRVVTCSSDFADSVRRYGELEALGWKGANGTAVTADNKQGEFYLNLLSRFSTSANGASIYEYWIDDQLAASRLVIATGKTLVILKTAFNESLSRFAPGRLLLYRLLQDVFERFPNGRVEFYTDASSDQLAWATHRRWIRHVSFYRSRWVSRLYAIGRAVRVSLANSYYANKSASAQYAETEIEVYHHPDQLPPDVCKIFEEAEQSSVEFGLSWYRNLIDSVYIKENKARIYVLRRHGTPIAALPVLINPSIGRKEVHALANYYSALYSPALTPLVKAIDLVPLIRRIQSDSRPIGIFRFSPMDPNSVAYRRLLNSLRSAGLLPFQHFSFGNWYLKVDSAWEDYLADREGTLRNTIKRMGKRFSADGGTFEIVLAGERLQTCIEAYQAVYSDSWKVPEPFPEFMPGLIRTCAEKGWLRLGVAWIRDQPIAAQVWIVANGKASIYKLAYKESAKDYAPGTLLTAHMMKRAIDEDHVWEVDYLIGDDAYKKSWMSNRRERWGIIAFAPLTIRGVLGLTRELLGRARRYLLSRKLRN